MISGLGQACLEYNLEVRMYALAFLCVMGCFYCSYRVIADGNRKTWQAWCCGHWQQRILTIMHWWLWES